MASKYNCDKMICRKCYVSLREFSVGLCGKVLIRNFAGTSSTASNQLPKEEMRTQQPAPPKEEAEVDAEIVVDGVRRGVFLWSAVKDVQGSFSREQWDISIGCSTVLSN